MRQFFRGIGWGMFGTLLAAMLFGWIWLIGSADEMMK